MEIPVQNQYVVKEVAKHIPISGVKNYKALNSQSFLNKIWKYVAIISKYLSVIRADAVIYTPDFQVLAIGIGFKKLLRLRKWQFIYHQFEVVEDKHLTGVNKLLWEFLKKNVQSVRLYIFPEENRQKYFNAIVSDKTKNFLIFANTCEAENNTSYRHPAFKNIPSSAIVFGHVGNMGTEHYFKQFIEIIEATVSYTNVFHVVVGRFSDAVRRELQKVRNANLILLEEVPHAELKTIYPFIDYGFILYRGVDVNFEYCAPNKLYEYWSYGIPVIAHPLSGLRKIFDTSIKGKLVDFEASNLIQELYPFFEQKPGKTELKNWFVQNVSITHELHKLESFLF
ncbi:MAG: glycosyltransferase [Agriterribacter sp.]